MCVCVCACVYVCTVYVYVCVSVCACVYAHWTGSDLLLWKHFRNTAGAYAECNRGISADTSISLEGLIGNHHSETQQYHGSCWQCKCSSFTRIQTCCCPFELSSFMFLAIQGERLKV